MKVLLRFFSLLIPLFFIACDSEFEVGMIESGGEEVSEEDQNLLFCQKSGFSFPDFSGLSLSLSSPLGLAVDSNNGRLYIADSALDEVKVVSLETGSLIRTIGSPGSGDGDFSYINGIAVDDDGNLYTADYSNGRVQVFDKDGNFVRKFGTYAGGGGGNFNGINDIAIYNNEIYTLELDDYRVQVFDLNGNHQREFGSYGSGNGQFYAPMTIEVKAGLVFVSDGGNNDRVAVLDTNGVFQYNIGGVNNGTNDGEFFDPRSAILNSDNELLVLDRRNDRIQTFDISGNFVSKFGTSGSGPAQFDRPALMDQDICGNLYIYDDNSNRVQILDSSFSYFTELAL